MNQKENDFAKKNLIPLLMNEHFLETKSPFNYINFWNYINNEYFYTLNEKTFSHPKQLVHKILLNGKFFIKFILYF